MILHRLIKMMSRIFIISIFIFVIMMVGTGCNVTSKYETRSELDKDEIKKLEDQYTSTPKADSKKPKEDEKFLVGVNGPVMRVNGIDVQASELRDLYEFMRTYRQDSPNVLKREACGEWITIAAVMSRWPETIESSKKKLEEIKQAALSGTPFEYLVVENTLDESTKNNGGELPPFGKRDGYAETYKQYSFSGKPGDIVGPFPTIFGWHLVKIVSFDNSNENNPMVTTKHLLLFHGLDSENGNMIREGAQRWSNLASVELLNSELDDLLPQYVQRDRGTSAQQNPDGQQ